MRSIQNAWGFSTGNYSCIFHIFLKLGCLNHMEWDELAVLQKLPDFLSSLHLVWLHKSKQHRVVAEKSSKVTHCCGNPLEQLPFPTSVRKMLHCPLMAFVSCENIFGPSVPKIYESLSKWNSGSLYVLFNPYNVILKIKCFGPLGNTCVAHKLTIWCKQPFGK